MAMAMASTVFHFPINRSSSLSASSTSLLRRSPPYLSVAAGPSAQLRLLRAARAQQHGSDDEKAPIPPLWEDLDYDPEGFDWEDQILEETMSLVAFMRMVLHSGRYESGDQLIPEHEKTVCERLLPYHPNSKEKIGPGIEHIIVSNHPDFVRSRCMFIVRKDGELADFSYRKCLQGLIKKKYPQHAKKFINKHLSNQNFMAVN